MSQPTQAHIQKEKEGERGRGYKAWPVSPDENVRAVEMVELTATKKEEVRKKKGHI